MEKGIKITKKRDRSENWLSEDKHLLTELVRERVSAIENKNTDTNTNSKKQAAWEDLFNSFNCMCKGTKRSIQQLKSQWGIIKMQEKKSKLTERKQVIATGGGPPPQQDPASSDDISAWLPNEFSIHSNEFDSDQINQVVSPLFKQFRKKKIGKRENENKASTSAVNEIKNVEIDCRKELHAIQMENEKKISRNLDLEEELIKKKIEYYEKKNKML